MNSQKKFSKVKRVTTFYLKNKLVVQFHFVGQSRPFSMVEMKNDKLVYKAMQRIYKIVEEWNKKHEEKAN